VNAVRLLRERNLHALDEFSGKRAVLKVLQLESGIRAVVGEIEGARVAVFVGSRRPGGRIVEITRACRENVCRAGGTGRQQYDDCERV